MAEVEKVQGRQKMKKIKKLKQYTKYPNISSQVDFATLIALKNVLLPDRKD